MLHELIVRVAEHDPKLAQILRARLMLLRLNLDKIAGEATLYPEALSALSELDEV